MSDPTADRSRAAFHMELIEATLKQRQKLEGVVDPRALNPQQRGFLAAKAALKLDDQIDPAVADAARAEAMRILCAMLGKNPQLATAFESSGIEVVVVSANRLMTDLPEFSSLAGVGINQPGVAGASRGWDKTRGVGGVSVGNKLYVAVTEENLLGSKVGPTVTAAGGGCYAKQYSTTSHEFAHALHIGVLDARQKGVITTAYRQRAKGLTIANDTLYFDGTLVELKAAVEKEWVDGPRMKMPGATVDYQVSDSRGTAWRNFTYRSNCKPTNCYAASDEREYFAQCVNAYLGSNGGTDPYTQRPRNNGQTWLRVHEPAALIALLDELFSPHGTSVEAFSGFGSANLPETNSAQAARTGPTLKEVIAERKLAKTAAPGNVKANIAMFEQLAKKK